MLTISRELFRGDSNLLELLGYYPKAELDNYPSRTREPGLLSLYIVKPHVSCFAIVFTSLRIQPAKFIP